MKVITVRNVSQAFDHGWEYLHTKGIYEKSRNGKVLVTPEPVTTVYTNPRERVLFHPARDANPFLHLFESLWMLAGRDDVAFLNLFTKNFQQFSDDGYTLNGSYGLRWSLGRYSQGNDQVKEVIDILSKDANSRRAVITMWERQDLFTQHSKDIPCNLSIAFRVVDPGNRSASLDMTVFNRSNDMIWGAYGANAVHMSFLQELIAGALGVQVGVYRQVSNNFHIYTELPIYEKVSEGYTKWGSFQRNDGYTSGFVETSPMIVGGLGGELYQFWNDLNMLFDYFDMTRKLPPSTQVSWSTEFFKEVVGPMIDMRFYPESASLPDSAPFFNDWCEAGRQWVLRRRAGK